MLTAPLFLMFIEQSTLRLTRKIQLQHYAQCERCGRNTHDALDVYSCPYNGIESLPPLTEEEGLRRRKKLKAAALQKKITALKLSSKSRVKGVLGVLARSPTNQSTAESPAQRVGAQVNKQKTPSSGGGKSTSEFLMSTVERKQMIRNASMRHWGNRRALKPQSTNQASAPLSVRHPMKPKAINKRASFLYPKRLRKFHSEEGTTVQEPAKPTTGSEENENRADRRAVFSPLLPFLNASEGFDAPYRKKKKPDDKEVEDREHAPTLQTPRHQDAIQLSTNGAKYGRHCKTMLLKSYPAFNMAESLKYALKSVRFVLCHRHGHIQINCPHAPVSAIEQRRRMLDIMSMQATAMSAKR